MSLKANEVSQKLKEVKGVMKKRGIEIVTTTKEYVSFFIHGVHFSYWLEGEEWKSREPTSLESQKLLADLISKGVIT